MLLGTRPDGGAVEIHPRPPHAQQRTAIGEVLQTGDGRLRGKIGAGWQSALRQLESRIGRKFDASSS